MFLLALVYVVILIVWAIFGVAWSDPVGRKGGIAQFVLFVIIGIDLFWSVLNKG